MYNTAKVIIFFDTTQKTEYFFDFFIDFCCTKPDRKDFSMLIKYKLSH